MGRSIGQTGDGGPIACLLRPAQPAISNAPKAIEAPKTCRRVALGSTIENIGH
jgi:hypothetical protein